jgi:hypothetical protein
MVWCYIPGQTFVAPRKRSRRGYLFTSSRSRLSYKICRPIIAPQLKITIVDSNCLSFHYPSTVYSPLSCQAWPGENIQITSRKEKPLRLNRRNSGFSYEMNTAPFYAQGTSHTHSVPGDSFYQPYRLQWEVVLVFILLYT